MRLTWFAITAVLCGHQSWVQEVETRGWTMDEEMIWTEDLADRDISSPISHGPHSYGRLGCFSAALLYCMMSCCKGMKLALWMRWMID